jgi:hypothetical protein
MTPIDYVLLGEAQKFYAARGFQYIEAPWLVSTKATYPTKPPECKDFIIRSLALVGSGEQSFVQLMLDGNLEPGKYQTITPCFRDETTLSDSTRLGFMKLELIHISNSINDLKDMICHATKFMKMHADIRVQQMGYQNQYDIVTADEQQLELGSYGMREYEDLNWIYGTGCAEPRLSIARSKNENISNRL